MTGSTPLPFLIQRERAALSQEQRESQLVSAQNTVRVALSPLGHHANPMAQSASTAQASKQYAQERW